MLRVGCRYSAVSPIYMSNDRLEPFNYHNIAFKRCSDVVSLERLDRLWFFRHHWFVKIGWFGKCWTDLLAFWGVWNRSRILNFSPDRLFFRFSRALVANSMDPDQTAPLGAIWSASILFAYIQKVCLKSLHEHAADDINNIFGCRFFWHLEG